VSDIKYHIRCSFHTCSLFYLPGNDVFDSFWSKATCLITHLLYHQFLVNGAPHVFVAKTKTNQSQTPKATLLKILHFLASSLSTDGRVGASSLKPLVLNHDMSSCKLGSRIDGMCGGSIFKMNYYAKSCYAKVIWERGISSL
jgi:hypothetical protein